jgi:hypothetical protein
MKSPFKFLDSYTKDNCEIFFGSDRVFPGPETLFKDFIPPLQGLMALYHQYRIGRCPMLRYFAPSARNQKFSSALKGFHIIKQDNVLREPNSILKSPVRA